MHPRARLVILLPCAACLVANPRFDAADDPAASAGANATVSGAAPTTSGTDPSGDSTDSASGTTGPGTTGPGTTGDATTDATTGEPASTGQPGPMQALLKHYPDRSQCDFTYWCVVNGNVNSPTNAETWDAECFDAPFAPPFTVDRVGFQVYGRRNSPPAALEFHEYDPGVTAPKPSPFATVSLGAIDEAGYLEFPLDPPVAIPFQRFCVAVHSGTELGSQLGIAVDDVPAPIGQTFVGMNGPDGCDVAKFTDIVDQQPASKNQWCIDATITRP